MAKLYLQQTAIEGTAEWLKHNNIALMCLLLESDSPA